MTESNQQQLRAVVHGRVQGVGFRDATQHRAVELGLTGWVRNQSDGTVETLAEGERDVLERFLAFLQRGPNAAHVTRVESRLARGDKSLCRFSRSLTPSLTPSNKCPTITVSMNCNEKDNPIWRRN